MQDLEAENEQVPTHEETAARDPGEPKPQEATGVGWLHSLRCVHGIENESVLRKTIKG
jgi:hypothetical protein